MTAPNTIHKLNSDESYRIYYAALKAITPETIIFANIQDTFSASTGSNFSPGNIAKTLGNSLEYIGNVSRYTIGGFTLYPEHHQNLFCEPQDLDDNRWVDKCSKIIRGCDVLLHNDEAQKPKVKKLMAFEMHSERMTNFVNLAAYMERHNHLDECGLTWRCINTMCDLHEKTFGPLTPETIAYLRLVSADERFPHSAEQATSSLRRLTVTSGAMEMSLPTPPI